MEENSQKLYKVFYNPALDVIDLDMSNLALTVPLATEIFDELIQLAKTQPHKVYLLVSWKNTEMPADVKDYYAYRLRELMPLIKGVARYEVTNFLTAVGVKVGNISTNNSPTIFGTRAEALEAIHKGKI